MTTGPIGHESETTSGPSSDRLRFTRRRVLVGLTATTVASVGTGVGLAALDNWSQWSKTGESTDCGVMVSSIGGPIVRASPPLVVSRLAPDTGQRRRVQVIVEDESTSPLALQFRRLEPDVETVDAPPDAELMDQLEIAVGIDGETLREGAFRTVFDGTRVRIDPQTRSGTTFQLVIDWRLPDSVTAREVHGVLASTLQFWVGSDASTTSTR